MCVAIVIPSGAKNPTVEELLEMEEANPDGAGVAWHADNEVHWLKGLEAKEVDALLGGLPNCTKLVHFRLATAGGSKPELTHPFPVEKAPRLALSGRARQVLIHNGHISDWELYAKLQGDLPGGPWSDTRLMARLAHTRSYKILNEFRGQKFALLDKTGGVKISGDWTKRDGALYSNMYWVGGSYTKYYSRKLHWERTRDMPPLTYGEGREVRKSERTTTELTPRKGRTGTYDDKLQGWAWVEGADE